MTKSGLYFDSTVQFFSFVLVLSDYLCISTMCHLNTGYKYLLLQVSDEVCITRITVSVSDNITHKPTAAYHGVGEVIDCDNYSFFIEQ